MSGAVVIDLTGPEVRTLAYVADRYGSAAVLYDRCLADTWAGCAEADAPCYAVGCPAHSADALPDDPDGARLTVDRGARWAYLRALYDDWGRSWGAVPPLIGGELARKLAPLMESRP